MADWDKVVDVKADFDSTVDVDGSMLDATAAMHDGLTGLEVTFDNATQAYGVANLGAVDQTSIFVNLKLNLNDVTLAAGKYLDIMAAQDGTPTTIVIGRLENNASQYRLRFYTRNDTPAYSGPINVNVDRAKWYDISVSCSMATGAGKNDGTLRVYIGGVEQTGSLTTVDSDTFDLDNVVFGMAGTDDVVFGGSYYLDTIKIRKWKEPVSLTAPQRDSALRIAV